MALMPASDLFPAREHGYIRVGRGAVALQARSKAQCSHVRIGRGAVALQARSQATARGVRGIRLSSPNEDYNRITVQTYLAGVLIHHRVVFLYTATRTYRSYADMCSYALIIWFRFGALMRICVLLCTQAVQYFIIILYCSLKGIHP